MPRRAAVGPSALRVERREHEGGEFRLEPWGESLVCVYLGERHEIEQQAGGRTRRTTLQRGSVQIMPEGDPRVFRHRHRAEHLHLHLPAGLLAGVADRMGRAPSAGLVPTLAADDATLHRLALSLAEDDEAGGPRGRLYADSLSTALVAHVLATYGAGPAPAAPRPARLPEGQLKRVTDFVRAHLADDLSLGQLAGVVGLSPSHFSALFRRATGLSPYQFVVRQRVERARGLLASGRGSIAEVASGVGFYDQSHLTRHMRRVLGVAPGRVRRGG